jgi:hypothetical protein
MFCMILLAGGIRAEEKTIWHDVRTIGVEGKAWDDTENFFDRLPARVKEKVRGPVWSLSRDSAGMCVNFETDSRTIRVRYRLTRKALAKPHMCAAGVSGMDLYAELEKGRWHWAGVALPTKKDVDARIGAGLLPGRRAYRIHLPLYNGVERFEIGVDEGAAFEAKAPRKDPPLVIYGTSITQGGCASRPGMAYPAILGRRLGVPVINLGFSGNGRMEAEIGTLLAEIDARVFVIDCIPNMKESMINERAELFLKNLSDAKPLTPIVVVEDRSFTNAAVKPGQAKEHELRRAALRKAFDRVVEGGAKNLRYVEGDGLLGDDGEAAVDGSHPTDLGMMRYAGALEVELRKIMSE